MKIARKISLSFFSTVFILVLTAGTVFYITSKDRLQKSIQSNLVAVLAARCNHIKTYLEMLKISVGQLSKSITLENFLELNEKEVLPRAEAFRKAMERITRTKEANPAIAEFLLMDETGKVVASSEESNLGTDKSTDALFLGAEKEIRLKDVYFYAEHKEFLLAVSVPFINSKTGKFLGVLAARVKLNELNEIVAERTSLGDTGEIYIVNQYGFMITPSRFKKDVVLKQKVDTQGVRQFQRQQGWEHVLSDEKLISVYTDYRGVLVLGAQEGIPEMRWSVIAEIDAKEAFQPLIQMSLIFLVVLSITPGIAWLASLWISGWISGPLRRLIQGSERIGAGDLNYKVGTDVQDELGQLSRAFDKMTESLKTKTTSVENLENEIDGRVKAEAALKRKAEELAKFNKVAIGRELKMIELKDKIKAFEERKL